MTNQPLLYLVPLIIVGLAIFWFFRNAPGERLVNRLRPKSSLTDASAWQIGPVRDLANGSQENDAKNMPLAPTSNGAGGFIIDMPTPTSEPHYITNNHGPLDNAQRITMKGNISIEAGGQFFAKDGVSQASICLYFQRQYDDWDATDMPKDSQNADLNQNTAYYRWFATNNAMGPIATGPFTLTASFDDVWTALRGDSKDNKTDVGVGFFKAARENGWRVGFVLGGGDGWGHGIIATKPAKIEVTSFEIS